RIEDILAPMVGLQGVRAQVVADVDFTMTEQTAESYNPDLAAIRSEQLSEDERVGGAGAGGVPGALANQPPGGGVAPEQVADEAAEGEAVAPAVIPGSNSSRTIRNYELDRTISHSRLAPGDIRKLNVAVLIDEPVNAAGEATPMSEVQMNRINSLVRDAVGFNEARGDSLNVVSAPFKAPIEAEPLPAVPIWEQAWAWDLGKQILGALVVLFLIFGVLRPAFKDLNKTPAGLPNQAGSDEAAEQARQAIAASANNEDIAKLTAGSDRMEAHMNNVRSLVQQDPALVAQVVKNWTASDA
ncbi:MAG: flagellar M-ring protein FliF C-terminal domain-containing protein, partial [Methylophaga sp.]